MTIKHALDAARASVPGCTVAAFGDASTRLILRASHHDKIRREYLDELCDEAAECFALLHAAADLSRALNEPGPPLTEAVTRKNRNAAVFVRTEAAPSEFLCLVCDAPGDMAAMSTAAHEALQQVSGSG